MTELVPAAAALSLSGILMKRGEMGETRQILETALQEKRLSPKTRSRLQAALASPLAMTGDPDLALQIAQEALARLPDLRGTVANSFIEHDQPVLAMKVMAPILAPLVLRDRVMTMAASLTGDPRAIELLDWLQAEYGDDGPIQVNLGLHWLALSEPEKARTAVATGLSEAPGAAIVELRLAYFEQVLGRPEDAEARLAATVQAAADADAQDWLAEAIVQWGNLAFQTNQWEKAADLLTEALTMRPQDPYLHYALASVRYGQGDLPLAKAGYERAIMIDPTYAPAKQGLYALATAQADNARP
jgi:tetratricopeptide (TPR) repeat protein